MLLVTEGWSAPITCENPIYCQEGADYRGVVAYTINNRIGVICNSCKAKKTVEKTEGGGGTAAL